MVLIDAAQLLTGNNKVYAGGMIVACTALAKNGKWRVNTSCPEFLRPKIRGGSFCRKMLLHNNDPYCPGFILAGYAHDV